MLPRVGAAVAMAAACLVCTACGPHSGENDEANAVRSDTVEASVLGSRCEDPIEWRGAEPGWWRGLRNGDAPTGTVTLCASTSVLKDDDPDFDYYSVTISSTWETNKANDTEAPATQSVSSSLPALDGVYSATPTFTSLSGCDSVSRIPTGAGWPSAIVRACSGATLESIASDEAGATWETARVQDVPKFVSIFSQSSNPVSFLGSRHRSVFQRM